ncbi:M48 family metallopeptidase [Trichocoleus sp. FACHB-262]|uniref:M48 family metallopeptidase n=1 Tax=Trichocoleus sp. FACHB-262 TaxID=2692869 RepID=UPI001687EEBA|nr:M48 family metallopeptidase [Trichocoleus sp. FACHB-262]MBD2123392.1 M48 family metalloprotease [Trichocoleus sp. FACHB-262]
MLNRFSTLSRRSVRRWLYPFISLAIAIGLVVGSPSPSPALPWADLIFRGVQIIQLSKVSDREEVAIGRQINQQLINSEFRLYRNRSINEYVDQIGQQLAAKSDRPRIPYTFQVVEDNRVNAFATAGGYVYVTTGLMKIADNEAQLASVLGHETGHVEGRHLLQQMRQTAIARGVATAAGLDRSTLAGIGVELALRRPNSRQDEFEADERGLRILSKAGYAPSAMVAFMEKLLKGGSLPTFLSTHPNTKDRIEALKRSINSTSTSSSNTNPGNGLDSAAYKAKIQPLLSRS